MSNENINFRVDTTYEYDKGDHVILNFEYLSPGDGALVSVFFDQKEPKADLKLVVTGQLQNGSAAKPLKGRKLYF